MATTKTIRHQDYDLLCGTRPLASGRFAPTLVISKQAWPSRPRTIAMRSDDCETEDEALESAHAQGIEWVRNYG